MARKQRKAKDTKKPIDETLVKEEEKEDEQPHVIKSLVGTLNEALTEDYSEIEDVMKQSPADMISAGKSPRKHRAYLIIGIFVIAMSIIGIISTVNFVKDTVYNIVDQRSLKNEIALFIYPAVAADIPTFETIEKLYPSSVLNAAIWKIILFEDTSKYSKNGSYITVPETDVEAAARSLFGTGFDIVHATTGAGDVTFTYNADAKCYTVLENPSFDYFSPVVTELSNVGETYTVRVDYMPPTAISIEDFEYENEPAKTLIFTISKNGTKSTIRSLAYAEVKIEDNMY